MSAGSRSTNRSRHPPSASAASNCSATERSGAVLSDRACSWERKVGGGPSGSACQPHGPRVADVAVVCELGPAIGDVLATRALEPDALGRDEHECAVAIPFHLGCPSVTGRNVAEPGLDLQDGRRGSSCSVVRKISVVGYGWTARRRLRVGRVHRGRGRAVQPRPRGCLRLGTSECR